MKEKLGDNWLISMLDKEDYKTWHALLHLGKHESSHLGLVNVGFTFNFPQIPGTLEASEQPEKLPDPLSTHTACLRKLF